MPERSPTIRKLLRYLPKSNPSPVRGLLVGLSCSVVAVLVRILIDPFVIGVPYVTVFPMLVVATVFGGLWGGLSTLLIGTVVGTFWLSPAGSLDIMFSRATALSFALSGGVVVGSIYVVNEAVSALRRSEARSAMIAQEMQHRIKNVLQLVQSISRLTVHGAASAEEHQERLSARIGALSRASEAPRLAPHLPVDLKGCLARLVEPFGLTHFILAGPPVSVADETGFKLGLAVHELATNAAKYGALSVPTGMVDLRWRLEDGVAELEWLERGGPIVNPQSREGFGSRLIKAAFVDEGGATAVTYEPEGVRCILRFRSAPAVAGQRSALPSACLQPGTLVGKQAS